MMVADIGEVVYNSIKEHCDRVYYQEPPEDAIIPYVVYQFPNEGRAYKDQVELYLEINIFDAERDDYNVSFEIDSLADNINLSLDHKSFLNGSTSFWMKRTSMIRVPFPEDVHIWSRQLEFQIKTYRT